MSLIISNIMLQTYILYKIFTFIDNMQLKFPTFTNTFLCYSKPFKWLPEAFKLDLCIILT
ncbi:TPA: hypothetical protein ACGI5J_003539, partial [Clostridioides difficile]|uniref:hypothetical protein n=1 Tax=Clostridioides difficile TaxID=1496 RepID=UPI00254F7816